MTNKNISQEVLDKIKEKKITPKPKWEFLVKNLLLWLAGSIALLFGSLSVSTAIYMIQTNDWDIHERVGLGPFGFALKTLPYFWIIFLILFLLLAEYNLRQTKKGYKYSLGIIFVATVAASIFLGSILHTAGMGKMIDSALARKMPVYHNFFPNREHMWQQPEKGLLVGTIKQIQNETSFRLEDLEKKNWDIIFEDGIIRGPIMYQEELSVRLIGEKVDNNIFRASEMRPWLECGGCGMHSQMFKKNRY